MDTIETVREALQDNFNTPKVIEDLLSLISHTHTYLNSATDPPFELLQTISSYIASALSMFGVTLDKVQKGDDSSYEAVVNALVNFRSQVRSAAQSMDTPSKMSLLKLSDNLRDNILPELSIHLEVQYCNCAALTLAKDKKDGPSTWKYYSRSFWLQQKQVKEEAMKAAATKTPNPPVVLLPPNEMFLSRTDIYSKFDDQVSIYMQLCYSPPSKGIPTHNASGEPLSLSARKKLKKQWTKRKIVLERKAQGKSSDLGGADEDHDDDDDE
jgi:cysteinyl-tRNA synthetase